MIPLNITLEDKKGVTTLSNVFIDEFMKDANDAQLKIYLYLLRMAGSKFPTDISEIADYFNHTEKDVIRALKYWEKKQLIRLMNDDGGSITGVVLRDVHDINQSKVQDDISEDSFTIVSEEVRRTDNIATSTGNVISVIKMDYDKEKASYSLDDIKAIKSNPEASMLLNIVSQYLGRTLGPSDVRTMLFIYDRLGFSLELTDYLVEFCVDHDEKSIHYIEKTAINWYENGIDTVAKAKASVKKADKSSYTIMGYLGKKGEITQLELTYTYKWTRTFGFSMSIIEEACNRTVKKTDSNRFAYADSILTSWFEKGVHTKKDITSLDEAFEAQKAVLPLASGDTISRKSDFCKIEKRDYDFDELERLARRK